MIWIIVAILNQTQGLLKAFIHLQIITYVMGHMVHTVSWWREKERAIYQMDYQVLHNRMIGSTLIRLEAKPKLSSSVRSQYLGKKCNFTNSHDKRLADLFSQLIAIWSHVWGPRWEKRSRKEPSRRGNLKEWTNSTFIRLIRGTCMALDEMSFGVCRWTADVMC